MTNPFQIKAELPSYFGNKPSPELESLVGATIVRIGAPTGKRRFGIEYCRPGSDRTEALVFGFSDTGLWIELG